MIICNNMRYRYKHYEVRNKASRELKHVKIAFA